MVNAIIIIILQYWQQTQWDDISICIHSKTTQYIKHALYRKAEKLGSYNIIVLLSAEAMVYRDALAQQASVVQTFQRYCCFSISNRIRSKTLYKEKILNKCRAISEKGIENIFFLPRNIKAKRISVIFDVRYL